MALFLRAWELGSKEIYDCVVHLPWGMMGSELRQGEPIATQITYMHIVQSKPFNLFMPIRSISSILYICHVCFTYDMETITCVNYITIHTHIYIVNLILYIYISWILYCMYYIIYLYIHITPSPGSPCKHLSHSTPQLRLSIGSRLASPEWDHQMIDFLEWSIINMFLPEKILDLFIPGAQWLAVFNMIKGWMTQIISPFINH